jgi:NTE family protein
MGKGIVVKILLSVLVLVGSLYAQERPKIALVLSGGGARGGAHVGVLKELEKNKIPIDMIVGTSMGSFVGGLYASGKTPQEIERMLVDTDWVDYINTDFKRQDIPMRKKELDYIYQGTLGMGVNSENKLVLPTGVLKREPLLLKFMNETQDVESIHNFDNLPIPYRAIATNIKNGEPVVLKSGSLAEAMYASSAIPGGFQPLNIDGVDLVDGGVSDNFPIQVARDMGADIIIAVDVSEDFDENIDVNSYFVVMGQLVNIMMRKNANESIKTLQSKDILLTPDLEGYSGLDADKYKEIIQKGVEVAKNKQVTLSSLSIGADAYEQYRKKYRKKPHTKHIVIDAIELHNNTYIHDESILRRISFKVGDTLDEVQLRKELLELYHLMIFDSIIYKIQHKDGKNTLVITAEPSWDNHGEIRASLGFEDDFQGHSAYSLKLGYTMYGINSYGASWRTNLEIGRHQRAQTEFFQPLDTLQIFYIKPSLLYESIVDIFPSQNYTDVVSGNIEIDYGRYGASFATGIHLYRDFEFEIGGSIYKDNTKINLEIENILPSSKHKYNASPLYARCKIDNLDNINFPKYGMKLEALWTKDGLFSGSDYDYEQFYIEVQKPFSFYSNNFTLKLKYGDTYKKNDDEIARLYGTYTLGGLFNLSGYAPYSFNDDSMFFGMLKYRYEIKGRGFFGVFDTPLYAGFSLETGEVWGKDALTTHTSFETSQLHNSASVYLAADTFLGPMYFAYGQADDGENSFYLYLGEKF